MEVVAVLKIAAQSVRYRFTIHPFAQCRRKRGKSSGENELLTKFVVSSTSWAFLLAALGKGMTCVAK